MANLLRRIAAAQSKRRQRGAWHNGQLVGGTDSVAATTMATATARERGEKYNLLHEGFPKLGASHMVVLVCYTQRVG